MQTSSASSSIIQEVECARLLNMYQEPTYNLRKLTQQEDHTFKASLDSIARSCLKTRKTHTHTSIKNKLHAFFYIF